MGYNDMNLGCLQKKVICGNAQLLFLFGLIDEAFETACQTYGTIAIALNMKYDYQVFV